MNWYHGTSDALNISDLLAPPVETGFLREQFRNSLNDVVFITNSLVSAEKFARKASVAFGGNPVVLTVSPIGECWHKGNGDFICYKAKILSERKL